MNSIIFSIVIPCYNVQNYINRCLSSITANNLDNVEIIFVNDGSTDQTLNIINDFCNLINQRKSKTIIKVISQKNKGVSAARNKGLSVAQGEYILFVDPDDFVDENWLDIIREHLVNKPDMLVLGFKKIVVDNNGNALCCNKVVPLEQYNISNNQEAIESMLPRYLGYSIDNIKRWANQKENLSSQLEYGPVWRNVYKRDIIVNNNIKFNEKIVLNEDSMFNARFVCNATSIHGCNDSPYNYLIRETGAFNSIMSGNDGIEKLISNKTNLLLERGMIIKSANRRKKKKMGLSDYAGSNVLSVIELMLKTPFTSWRYLRKFINRKEIKYSIRIMPFTKMPKFNIPLLLLKLRLNFLLFLLIKGMCKIGINISV